MEKSKKLKISIGLIYLTIVSLFLIYFFNKFEIEEVRSYEFIKSNRDYFYRSGANHFRNRTAHHQGDHDSSRFHPFQCRGPGPGHKGDNRHGLHHGLVRRFAGVYDGSPGQWSAPEQRSRRQSPALVLEHRCSHAYHSGGIDLVHH